MKKKIIIAAKSGRGMKSITLTSAIITIKSLKKLFIDYPELKFPNSYKIMVGDSGNSYIESIFSDCEIEFTMMRSYYNSKEHLLYGEELDKLGCDYLIYADLTQDENFKAEVYDLTDDE